MLVVHVMTPTPFISLFWGLRHKDVVLSVSNDCAAAVDQQQTGTFFFVDIISATSAVFLQDVDVHTLSF